MNAINVAVGIILNASRTSVLLARRNKKDSHLGKWEFPGGKIDQNETAQQALNRELTEELNINVLECEPYDYLEFDYPHQSVKLNFFLVTAFDGMALGAEGQKISWVKLSRLKQIDMLQANEKIIDKLMQEF